MTKTYPRAPRGDLNTFVRERFDSGGIAHDVYRKGQGPAVLVLTEMPGISPMVLGFADRLVELGLTAVLPDLFGRAGRDPEAGGPLARALYIARSVGSVCVRREFQGLVSGGTLPVIAWLRALAEREHERCKGPGVGVVGMCFTGGFALAMAVDPRVLAPVLSQPSLPVGLSSRTRSAIDCDERDLSVIEQRCARDGLRVLGLRFHDDPLVPRERFEFLRKRLGDGFIAVEIEQTHGHPDSPMRKHHSVLTVDLVDALGEPTRVALERVLALLQTQLRPPT